MNEIFRTKKNLHPFFMQNIFMESESYYSLRSDNHLPLKIQLHIAKITLNVEVIFYGPHCQIKLKILTHFLSSRGELNYGKGILAPVDCAKLISRIYSIYEDFFITSGNQI